MQAALNKMRATLILLLIIAAMNAALAIITFGAPDSYLYGRSVLWAILSMVIAVTCLLTVISKVRIWAALSGTLMVFMAASRAAIDFFASRYTVDDDPSLKTWALTFGCVWVLVGLLSFELWRQVIVPWAVMRERRYRQDAEPRPDSR